MSNLSDFLKSGVEAAGIISVADSSAIWVDVDENVGIGTASPSEKLHIYGDSSSDVTTRIENDGTGDAVLEFALTGEQSMSIGIENTTNGFVVANGPELSSFPKFTVLPSGRIGIGTASPVGDLHVARLNGTPSIHIERIDTTVNDTNPIGTINWRGGEDGTTETVATFGVYADGAWTATSSPTYAAISTTPPEQTGTPVEVMRIDSSGNTTLTTGNLVIGTAGKGIDFSAVGGAAGMTSKVLDDYEEGTWTPAAGRYVGGNITGTYGAQNEGTYTKIGNQVMCNFRVHLASVSSQGSGACIVTGLPFTLKTNSAAYGSVGTSETFTGTLIGRSLSWTSDVGGLRIQEEGVSSLVIDVDWTVISNGYLEGSITYDAA